MITERLLQLKQELMPYRQVMAQAVDSILDQEVSKYPVFVVHQHEVEIGVPLVTAEADNKWSIHASTLEEFVSKQIVEEERIDSFIDVYKDPREQFCLFVLSELGANFIFLPHEN